MNSIECRQPVVSQTWTGSSILSRLVSSLAYIYCFVGFGLTGVPILSRLSFVAAIAMGLILLIHKRRFLVPPWVLVFSSLYLFLLLPALVLPNPSWEMISGTTTVFIGSLSVGLALKNKLVKSQHLAYCMVAAAALNIIAVSAGIDTTPEVYQTLDGNRFSGLLGNSNALSVNFALMAFTVWLPFHYFSAKIRALAVLFAFYGIYISGSRKGIILGAALLLMVGKRLAEKLSAAQQFLIVLGISLISAILYLSFDDLNNVITSNVLAISRFAQIFSGGETSFSERKWLFETGQKIWLDSPLIGSGLGQFATLSGFGAYSHNNFIELLVSGGVIALVLYYALYLMVIWQAAVYLRRELFYAGLIILTLTFIDTAAVSFFGKSSMLFLVILLTNFAKGNSRISQG